MPTRRPRPLVLGAAVFRSAVIRERKRTERSGRAMLLVLVTAARRGAGAWPGWPKVIARLTAVLDVTDMVGWYEPDAVLGVVRPMTGLEASPSASDAGGEVGRGLRARVEYAVGPACAVRVLLYPEPGSTAAEDLGPIEPGLYPEIAFRRRSEQFGDTAKRALDVAGSFCALVVLAPLLALIAAMVKLTSPGPAFFAQTRVGHLARPFTVRKFRTMYVNTDAAVHREFVGRFIAGGDGNGGQGTSFFKLTNDPRVTPVGRFLRKTSLDELPQLWNVLRGDMSLVGPRPPLPYEYAQYRAWHRRRVIEAKPGITGLWQISGRSRTTFDEMVRLDLRYARTRSLRRDLAIIGRTPPAVISGRGAC